MRFGAIAPTLTTHPLARTWRGAAQAVLVLLALLALLAPPGRPAVAAEAQPLVIGVNLAMTGPAAAYGQMCLAGMQIAQEMAPEVLGQPVKLVVADNKSDPVEAANAAHRLMQKEEAVALLGPEISSSSLAAGALAEKQRVPMIAPVATNPNVTQGKTYVFRTCFVDSFQGAAAARYAYEKLKARTVAMLIDVSQDYAVGLAAFFSREFTRLGGKVVAQARCNGGDQDFSAQIGAIKAVSPDVFYLPNYPNEIALASRQAQELGLTTPILCGDGADAPELIKIGGEAVEGLTFTAHFDRAGAVTPRGQDFLARYGRLRAQGKVDQDLTGFHALGADAYLVLVDAIARAGSSQGPKIRQALVDTANFPGITGKISLGESGNAVKSVTVLKVAQGRFNYVTTMEP